MKSGDALSQWFNVTFLRRHHDTNANESTSGRCHREAQLTGHWTWVYAEKAIDILRFTDRDGDKGHCELSVLRDYERAKETVRKFEARQPTGGGTH